MWVAALSFAAWSAACRPHCPQLVNNRLRVSPNVQLHVHHWIVALAGMAYLNRYHLDEHQSAREVLLGTVAHGLTYRDAFVVIEREGF
jgi:hypothetical protein